MATETRGGTRTHFGRDFWLLVRLGILNNFHHLCRSENQNFEYS